MKLVKIYQELLSEGISTPNLRMAKNVNISDEEKLKIRNLNVNDLNVSQGDYDGKIANMNINLPWDSDINNGGVIVDVQVIGIDGVNVHQVHIDVSKNARSLGLGYKSYVALVQDLGHVYSGKGRRMNTSEIPKIWNKLGSEENIDTYTNNRGNVAILNTNPNKSEILKALGF